MTEAPTYECPSHSSLRQDSNSLYPKSFKDCVCEAEFERDADKQLCKPPSAHRGSQEPQPMFQCPDFSIALTLMPYGMNQCMCLPGFSPSVELEMCVWNPESYKCPEHSYNPHPDLYEVEFSNCKCAKGYQRNEIKLRCDPAGEVMDTSIDWRDDSRPAKTADEIIDDILPKPTEDEAPLSSVGSNLLRLRICHRSSVALLLL